MGRIDLELLSKAELIEMVLGLQRRGPLPGSMSGLWSLPVRGFDRRSGQRTRHDRLAQDFAGGGASSSHGGDLPVLRPAGRGRLARRGDGHAVRTAASRGGDLSEDVPGSVL